MANTFGLQMGRLRNSSPVSLPHAADVSGRVRCFTETVTLAAQPAADTIEVARLPKGARVLYGMLQTTVTLGAATIAIGITGTTGKYRAAATFTTADTPTLFGLTAVSAIDGGLLAEEIVIITIAAAALPGAGTLKVMIFYTID